MDDELIPIGQALITREEYENNKAYYDGLNIVGNVGAPAPKGEGISLSEMGDELSALINGLENRDITYKFDSGYSEDNLLLADKVVCDDYHLASWVLFNANFIENMTIDDANNAKTFITNSDKLVTTSPASTSSDSDSQKLTILNDAQMGDILLFDTFQKNGNIGIYIGEGKFYTLTEQSGLIISYFWIDNEFGVPENTGWLKMFNGTIRRAPRLNEDDYKWYVQINGTVS